MSWFRCYACQDKRPGMVGAFREFEADAPLCPYCGGGSLVVVRLTPVHFLHADAKGPIPSRERRFRLACMPRRDFLAESRADDFAATGDPRAVTCPSCLATEAYKEASALFPEIAARRLIEEAAGDCC